VPIWGLPYFLTQDGPSHLDNAVVLRDYFRLDRPILRDYYVLNPTPNPNWLGHVVLALLASVLPVIVAEKIVLTACVVLLPLSVRYALIGIDREARHLAILSFPFVYSALLHFGFYNFHLSVPLAIFAVGFWIRRRGILSVRDAIGLGLLLGLVYFGNLISFAIAILAMGALAVSQTLEMARRPPAPESTSAHGVWRSLARRLGTLVAASVPCLLLALVYFANERPGNVKRFAPSVLWDRFWTLHVLVAYGSREALVSRAVFVLFAGLLVVALARRLRERRASGWDGLAACAVVILVLYVAVPSRTMSASAIGERLVLFTFLVLILWLATVSFGKTARGVIALAATFLSLAFLAVRMPLYARFSEDSSRILAAAPFVEPNSTLLPVSFAHLGRSADGRPLSSRVMPFLHAAGTVTALRGCVNLANYEASSTVFLTRYRREVNPYVSLWRDQGSERKPPEVNLAVYTKNRGRIDYVLIWGLEAGKEKEARGDAILRQLEGRYEPVYVSPERGLVRLYRSKARPGTG
jgi:hypothetical protein